MTPNYIDKEIQNKIKEFEKLVKKQLTREEKLYLQIGMQIGIKMGLNMVQKEIK